MSILILITATTQYHCYQYKSAIRIPVTIVISKQTATIAFILLFFLNEFSPTNTFEVAHKNYYEKEVGI